MSGPIRRCTTCGVDWPNANRYGTCPECEGRTDPMSNGNPLDEETARSRALHAEFERYYAKREADREAREKREREAQLAALDAAITAPDPPRVPAAGSGGA